MINVTAAVIVNSNNEIFIGQRKYPKELAGLWEFPGGKIKKNEEKTESLVREIKEELSVEISVKKFIAESTYEYKFGKVKLFVYLAKLKSNKIKINEHNDFKWVNLEEITQYKFVPADIKIIEKLKENKNEIFSSFSKPNI